MSWLDNTQVSFYDSHLDNYGRAATMREVLLCPTKIDLEVIIELRKLDPGFEDYEVLRKKLKSLLQCYTPATLLKTKAKGQLQEVKRSGLMQLDFDHHDIADYDLEELKRCVFDLPFIAFCGKSCSGDGFYALAMIAEPERLADYAEHCFHVLDSYGIKADRSKGKKPENLRYVSYDSNMLIRVYPEPLRIKTFVTAKKDANRATIITTARTVESNSSRLVDAMVNRIEKAQKGNRWLTVQQVAYTLGGLGNVSFLDLITSAIDNNPEFNGEEDKYKDCAEHCFTEGLKNPLKKKISA